MSLEPFSKSEALTFGVELELQLVNRHDHDLASASPDLLRMLKGKVWEAELDDAHEG